MTQAQRTLLKRFGMQRIVDVHCHCLPGLDDGPGELSASVELCRALAENGITDVIATPHQLGRYEGKNAPSLIRQGVENLNAALEWSSIPLKVHPGGDVRVHERLVELLEADAVMTAADGKHYLMLELPHEPFIDVGPMVDQLLSRGIVAVITHPERHDSLVQHPQMLMKWVQQGAAAQVTAGSLLGEFGDRAESAAWDWLGRGVVSLVASDAHDLNRRPPRMREAIEQITRKLSHVIAQRVCGENPARLLAGEPLASRGMAATGARR